MSPAGAAPAQPSLRRLQRFGVRPDRELGQNFLIDSNILGVIGREAELAPSRRRARDRRRPGRAERVPGRARGPPARGRGRRAAAGGLGRRPRRRTRTCRCGGPTRCGSTWARWSPHPARSWPTSPTGSRPASSCARCEELPAVGAVGGDGPARGGRAAGRRAGQSAPTGVPSVLAQLACEVRVVRAIPRTVFYPVPNVDSVLVRLTRRSRDGRRPGELPEPRALRALVAASFAHRRKTLVGSLRLAGAARTRSGGSASGCGRRWARSGWPPTYARSASRRRSSWRSRGSSSCEPAVGRSRRHPLRTLAPAKVNLGLFVGPVRSSDGRHELVTRDAVRVAGRRAQPGAGATGRTGATRSSARGCRAPRRTISPPAALAAFRAGERLAGTAASPARAQANPAGGGAGGGLGRRGGAR